MEKILLAVELCEMVLQDTQQLRGAVFEGFGIFRICVSAHGLGPAAGAVSPGQVGCQGDGHKPV